MEKKMLDPTLYIACHPSVSCFSKRELSESILTPFEIQVKEQIYILRASDIMEPLTVVRNFGSTRSTSFVQVSHPQYWGNVFKRLIMTKHPHLKKYDEDDSDEQSYNAVGDGDEESEEEE